MRIVDRSWIARAAYGGGIAAISLNAAPAWAGIKVFTGDDDESVDVAEGPLPSAFVRFDPEPSDRMALVVSMQGYTADGYQVGEAITEEADAIENALRSLGYRVMRANDLDRDALLSATEEFAEAVQPGGTVIVHYAGLGVALPFERDNRLLPATYSPAASDDAVSAVREASVALDAEIAASIRAKRPGAIMVFHDGCAATPLLDLKGASACEADPMRDTATLYASDEKTVADVGPLSRALLEVVKTTPSAPIEEAMRAMGARVTTATNGTQEVQVSLALSPRALREGVCIAPVDGACAEPEADPGDEISLDIEDYVPPSGEPVATEADKADVAAITRICDELAAHPGNTENPEGIAGVRYGAVDGTRALPACQKAVEVAPKELRQQYQLARAKQAAGQEESALEDLLRLAEEDQYTPAMNNLGATYQLGIGVPKSYGEAARWYQVAAERGFAPSMAVLGWMYQAGRGVPKNNSTAFKWYKQAAEAGIPSAMHNLGFMYQNGWGVGRDETVAASWFVKAADEDFPQAKAMVGWLYQTGRGVPQDMAIAVDYYRDAAASDIASAMGALGGLYDSGGDGVRQSPHEAARWLMKAVRKGHEATRARLIDQPKSLRPDTRKEVQKLLQQMGFDPGPADGVFGKKTRDALDQAFTAP